MKVFSKLNAEKSNVWSFITFLAEVAAAVYLVRVAYYEANEVLRIVLAVIAAVLVINLLAKLYTLIRK